MQKGRERNWKPNEKLGWERNTIYFVGVPLSLWHGVGYLSRKQKSVPFNTKTQIVNQESKIIIQFATISCLKDLAYTYISCIRYDVHYVFVGTLAIAMLLHFMPDINRWRNEWNFIKSYKSTVFSTFLLNLTTSQTNERHNVQVLKQIGLKPISYNRILYSIQSVSEGETSFLPNIHLI